MDVGTEPVVVTAAPSPKSPPKYPDLCGRRRLQLEVQILNREIGFLEEELQALEGLQPVSGCCKEVEEFLGSNPDPLVPINEKQQSSCRFWKWLRSAFRYPFVLLSCSSRILKKALCCCCCCCSCCCSPPDHCSCSLPKECGRCSRRCRCFPHPCCNTKLPCRLCECNWVLSCFHCCSTSCCSFCSCFHLSCSIPPCSTCTSGCNNLCCCPLKTSCCSIPQCPAWVFAMCLPWRWSCCCSCKPLQSCCCREISCTVPRPTCPSYSCGCIWSCSKCAEARRCQCSGKTSCISGCLC
ncbi:hypothetical protein HPP92_004363 [Vanilla planifolia]|uniref:G protein gamma domain-containing protein n=1 Tax=Vanilla planifolia TaxID=51239 RepID=A0A835VI20_VANPL|nr:hypothetical protein HPP92_004363 [Vanilla planifolia]